MLQTDPVQPISPFKCHNCNNNQLSTETDKPNLKGFFDQFDQTLIILEDYLFFIQYIFDTCSAFLFQINAEFMRITTVPLETKFLAQLDKHMSKLLDVIRSKGGRVQEQTKRTLQVLDETVDITIRRECILKSLMIYLGEPVHHLIKEYQENEADELEQATMAIVVSGQEDIKIVIDGIEVLKEVPTTAAAVAMFFGLTYALKLKYPKNLQHTLEFVQKVLMELGGKNMSPKVHRLSTLLYNPE
ncbi:uncharacterized protein LOC131474286 [Solea solea]|uniref:uncharacterized protein LOC131450695 n=1 Tax=Solea solea TaxID=90069 RepID=UPI00272C011F|nr:uncharacterized protein LOC131450695 [Solea solea]XP_058478271.1 uncharacterized protein LOC131451234 [Solea solea]XP_058478437.1 uncharacterized protein LOC131453265 [Solea solea]XP_058478472.1 uncharacterized protein LOC131453663 [Solea solea]XP_058488251.1 uncharacterized protein LOC131461200 [Solea solea]XP_058508060.1 uncharacterized protein LOC131474286 [Solea solea]